MTVSTHFPSPNGLILVFGSRDIDIPKDIRGSLVAVTNTCIAVGTLPDTEGCTLLRISNELDDTAGRTDLYPVFEGAIPVDTGQVSLNTVELKPILSMPVSNGSVRVEVWANHRSVPSEVHVVVKT